MAFLQRFKRTNFYQTETVNNVLENDVLLNNFDLFEITRPVTYFTLSPSYIQRPDLLSIKFYGDQQYWWLILKINTIDDPWNEMIPETVIIIPNMLDIEDFYLRVKARLVTK